MNKRIYLIILLLTCSNVLSNAQTNVSGFISANTTWNLAGSPYIVVGNALLSHGYTLTIVPGVVVKFNTDKALQIDGELIAIGTLQNRITFTSNQVSPFAGDWAKIHFPDTCVDAVFDNAGNYLSGSIMKYCDVVYGGGLGSGEIHIETSSPYINNCNILNSATAGIYARVSESYIDSSSIKNCNDYGIYMTNISTAIGNVYLRYDTIENNIGGGINLGPNGNSNYLILSNNYFISNTGFGALVFTGIGHINVIIEENTFVSNTGASVIVGDYLINNYIDCNKFINNTGTTLNLSGANWYEGTIRNNIFEGNNSPDNIITIKNYINASSPAYFYNNTVINNTSVGSCFKINAGINNNQLTHIRNNDFSNNIAPNTILIEPVLPPSGNYNFLYMKHNNFSNPLAQYELYNNVPYGSANIYIDSNYWGSNSTQHIDSVIYDYFDFANQSVVYYSPILSSAVVIDTTCPPSPTGISSIEKSNFNPVVYPNPVTEDIVVAFDKIIKEGKIEIFNILGGKVLQENIYASSKKEINLRTISNGIYLVKLYDGEKYYCKKIIVEHN